MRTTVTLESDVARMLDDHARRTRKSFKETLNHAVGLGLSRASDPAADADFVIKASDMGLRSGIALQEKAVIHSNGTDFLRVPGVRLHNRLLPQA